MSLEMVILSGERSKNSPLPDLRVNAGNEARDSWKQHRDEDASLK